MARVNGFELLGKVFVVAGVLGEAGAKIYMHFNPNCAAKAVVADTLGIQGDQVLLFKSLLLLQEYGIYAAAAGLVFLLLAKLPH